MTVIGNLETFFWFCWSNRTCPLRKLGVSEALRAATLQFCQKLFFPAVVPSTSPPQLLVALPNLGANVRDSKNRFLRATDFDGNWSVFCGGKLQRE